MLYKGEIPFVRLLIPFIAGIFPGYALIGSALYDYALGMALLSFIALVLLVSAYKTLSIYRFTWLGGLLIHLLLFLTAYCLIVRTSGTRNEAHFSRQRSELLITSLTSEPRLANGILRFEASTRATYYKGKIRPSDGKILVSVQIDSTAALKLKYGDIISVPAVFKPVDAPYNPGEFDYRSYLSRRQICFQSFLSQDEVLILRRDAGNLLNSYALDLRQRLVYKFHRFLPDKDAAAFASTLILGYRAELSQELIEAYSKTGTMHVLSVSGMHVGIVFMVLSCLLKFMDYNKFARLSRALFIILAICFYAFITGFSAPACRAALMLSFIVLGKALNRNHNTYNLIAISLFFLLLYNPFYLFDTGFQLSYLAVTGLVYFHPKIYRLLYIKNRLLDYTWSYSALSGAAQLATFPLSIYYFHHFPFYFLLSNLFIVLPVALIMYAGMAFMLLPGSILLEYLGSALAVLINVTNKILYWIENMPFSSWSGIWISTGECVLIYLLIACLSLRFAHDKKQVSQVFAGMLILLCLSFSVSWYTNYSRAELIYFNLRTKSAVAYVEGGRSVIVSEVTPSEKLVSFSILPAVQSKGSKKETFYKSNQSFADGSYTGVPNFYQFREYRLIRWDKIFDRKFFSGPLQVDAVLISNNPAVTIKEINSCVKFTQLVLDANNSSYNIDRWVAEAKEMRLSYYVLKKNPALVVKL
jgi:competence protein ComEC